MRTIANNKYRAVTQLSRKAASYTYLAISKKSSTEKVVVKVLDSIYLKAQDDQDRFLTRMNTLMQQLCHPYIVPILDAGIDKQHPYIVSAYMPRGSLDHCLNEVAQFTQSEKTVRILLRIGQALAHAHAQNIVHGNLKPENIFFNARDMALLADFALFNAAERGLLDDSPDVRAAYYMAPEQFAGQSTPKSDQYALGCIAYQLFTGQPPFNARAFSTMRMKHTVEAPTPPTKLVPDLPGYVEAAILKALAKNPEDRFENVLSFISALNDITAVEPVAQALPQYAAVAEPVVPMAMAVQSDWSTQPMELSPVSAPETPTEDMVQMQRTPEVLATRSGQHDGGTLAVPAVSSRDAADIATSFSKRKRTRSLLVAGALLIVVLVALGSGLTPLLLAATHGTLKTPQRALSIVPHSQLAEMSTETPAMAGNGMATPAVTPTVPAPTMQNTAPTQVPVAQTTLINPGFETPVLNRGDRQVDPANAGWFFSGRAGITSNGSFSDNDAPAPNGFQAAYLRGGGAMSQTNVWSAGTTKLSFFAAESTRNNAVEGVEVFFDGNPIGIITPTTFNYQLFSTNQITVTPGTHNLAFVGLDGDNNMNDIILIDTVTPN